MNDEDPIAGRGYEMAELFAHAPTEFELRPWKLSWDAPCWLDANIVLGPRSESSREHFVFNLTMPHKIDAEQRHLELIAQTIQKHTGTSIRRKTNTID